MKKLTLSIAGALAAGCLVPVGASALGFDSVYYDPGNDSNDYLNWTMDVTRVAPPPPTTGAVYTPTTTPSTLPGTIRIVGQDDGGATSETPTPIPPCDPVTGGCGGDVRFYVPAAGAGTVSFSFEYSTADFDASVDPFGYILDAFDAAGNPVAGGDGLIDPLDIVSLVVSGVNVSGSDSFSVVEDQLFGWFVNTADNMFGAAETIISAFDAPDAGPIDPPNPNPAPATLALLGFALLIPGLRKRR